MYDMHYDLLTILYFNLKPDNKYSNIDKLIEDCKKIYQNNIKGGIINLYFMPQKEMLEELDINNDELKDVPKMLEKSIQYLNILKRFNVIPDSIEFIYSIEGCDYIKDEQELEVLYDLGVRAILPVWNAKNKFGSGNRSQDGLTELGKRLVKKAIELGIIIDLSHANKGTFNDILNIVEQEQKDNKDIIVMASHSNVKFLHNRDRNLDDDDLIRLKNVGGYIGLFTNSNFLSPNNKKLSYKERQNEYIKHLNYIINNIGFDITKIIVSTDDMNFHPDLIYHNVESFPIETISEDIHYLLSHKFNEEVATSILINNPKTIIDKVKNKKDHKKLERKK